jgi:hypothetical protein
VIGVGDSVVTSNRRLVQLDGSDVWVDLVCHARVMCALDGKWLLCELWVRPPPRAERLSRRNLPHSTRLGEWACSRCMLRGMLREESADIGCLGNERTPRLCYNGR